jgi:hypothetical protein
MTKINNNLPNWFITSHLMSRFTKFTFTNLNEQNQ